MTAMHGPRTPHIIAIEGLDASGKTTQAALLACALADNGWSVGNLSFPRYETFFGSQIGKLLKGDAHARADTLDPRSMALWFAMDRWDAWARGVPECDVLLINRWTLSNAVYQGARAHDLAEGDAVFDWVLELETKQLGLPTPILTVLLDVSVPTSMARATTRATQAGATPDVYESHEALLSASRRLYQRAAAHGHGVLVNVDDLAADLVHSTVLGLVSSALETSSLSQ